MRMGRVLGLVAAALVLAIGGLVLAVYLTRDEDNIQADNILSENISKAIALANDPNEGTHGVVTLADVADFGWDRVLLVSPGVSRERISEALGRKWTGIVGIDAGELMIFRDGQDVARFANYRGTGSFRGLESLQEVARDRARLRVRGLAVTLER
jgi:hypothetical protein